MPCLRIFGHVHLKLGILLIASGLYCFLPDVSRAAVQVTHFSGDCSVFTPDGHKYQKKPPQVIPDSSTITLYSGEIGITVTERSHAVFETRDRKTLDLGPGDAISVKGNDITVLAGQVIIRDFEGRRTPAGIGIRTLTPDEEEASQELINVLRSGAGQDPDNPKFLDPEYVRVDVWNLLGRGADINYMDKDLYTPIMRAISIGQSPALINYLIESGADVNHVAQPLSAAVFKGEPEFIELLVRAGADINHRDGHGQTLLDQYLMNLEQPYTGANQHDYAFVIRSMLECGADVTAKDLRGKDILTRVKNHPNEKVREVFAQYEAGQIVQRVFPEKAVPQTSPEAAPPRAVQDEVPAAGLPEEAKTIATIRLTNGNEIQAEVVEDGAEKVKVVYQGVALTFDRKDVTNIEKK
ncbi:MAG: ankyrin repeat domain-containing protein [Candidatus Omnitrophota bacterium]|nr:ankyrin repeat domain-containing protein [Candidatus Omnitrophota bacterium]